MLLKMSPAESHVCPAVFSTSREAKCCGCGCGFPPLRRRIIPRTNDTTARRRACTTPLRRDAVDRRARLVGCRRCRWWDRGEACCRCRRRVGICTAKESAKEQKRNRTINEYLYTGQKTPYPQIVSRWPSYTPSHHITLSFRNPSNHIPHPFTHRLRKHPILQPVSCHRHHC